MSEASELLATLRDIGEPPPPEGVPPAPVLADVVLLALVLGALAWRRRRRRRAWLDTALGRLLARRPNGLPRMPAPVASNGVAAPSADASSTPAVHAR